MTKQLATLAFFVKYDTLGWSSFDQSVKRTIEALEKKGFLKVDWETYQARFTGKTWV